MTVVEMGAKMAVVAGLGFLAFGTKADAATTTCAESSEACNQCCAEDAYDCEIGGGDYGGHCGYSESRGASYCGGGVCHS